MSRLLNDMLNLDLLELLCAGEGVEVNVSRLARIFKKHRNTIKDQVNPLFEKQLIQRPVYPFMYLYREYPLFVIARADLPRNDASDRFMRENENIFAGFYVRDEEYNTLLFEYHPDLHAYGLWKDRIVNEKLIPPRENRYPSHALFFSTHQMIKYAPHSPILNLEKRIEKEKQLDINGYRLNMLGFQIMKRLMLGEGIRTNENLIAVKLGVHRKTVERRIEALLNEKVISQPTCRFPKFFVPPNNILVYSIIEVKKTKEKIFKAIANDPFIPIAYEASVGRYNLLLLGAFTNVEEHFEWEEGYNSRFPDCIGATKTIYVSPKKTASIDQQKVSLNIIKHKRDGIHGKNLMMSLSEAT